MRAIQHEVVKSLEAVVAAVPGATLTWRDGGKHKHAVVTLACGKSRFYVVQSSKMGRRSILNTTAGLRRMIREMQS